MDTQEDDYLKEDIGENAFFHDFLFFLQEGKKRPLVLTKTGNLKRTEIYYFGEYFSVDIYHRDEKGLILFPIRTEDEAPYLLRIRALAHVMKVVRKRKDKLLLSAKGDEYLTTLTQLQQFEELILAAFTLCNWGYLHPALYKIADVLQKNQHYLWSYFIKHKDKPIIFQTFFEGVCTYFGLKNTNEYHDSARWAFERVIVQDLCLYGLMEAKTEKVKWNENVVSFQPTELGVHMFEFVLEDAEVLGVFKHDGQTIAS